MPRSRNCTSGRDRPGHLVRATAIGYAVFAARSAARQAFIDHKSHDPNTSQETADVGHRASWKDRRNNGGAKTWGGLSKWFIPRLKCDRFCRVHDGSWFSDPGAPPVPPILPRGSRLPKPSHPERNSTVTEVGAASVEGACRVRFDLAERSIVGSRSCRRLRADGSQISDDVQDCLDAAHLAVSRCRGQSAH